jgi:hypothetical protein
MLEHSGANIRLQLNRTLVRSRMPNCLDTYCQSTLRRPVLEAEALHKTFGTLAVAATTSTLSLRLALVHTIISLLLVFPYCLGLIPIGLRLVPCASFIGLRVGLLQASIPATLLGSWTARFIPACRLRLWRLLVCASASAHTCRSAAHLASTACLLLRCDDGTGGGSTLAFPVVPCRSGCLDAMCCEVERIGFVG